MAGDWLKVEISTPEKAETMAITAAMGWDDIDLTVGKLFRVWRWFDQQTIGGNAPGVNSALLDRIAGATGFADAMQSVGWLVIDENGISLPNFDRHNGETAKSRALTSRRVTKFNAKVNATTVNPTVNPSVNPSVSPALVPPLPREEKRREDKGKQINAHAIPNPFNVNDDVRKWAAAECPEVDLDGEVSKFVDHHIARGSVFKNWDAALRTWVRNAKEWSANARTTTRPNRPAASRANSTPANPPAVREPNKFGQRDAREIVAALNAGNLHQVQNQPTGGPLVPVRKL